MNDSDTTIDSVRVVCPPRAADPDTPHWLLDDPMATPAAHLPGMRDRRALAATSYGVAIVEICTRSGFTGFGIGAGGRATAAVIERLAPLLVGRDSRDVGAHWEWMHRLCGFEIGFSGPPIMAVAAIDLALWDLLGKTSGRPVATLLGGKTNVPMAVYVTGPDAAAGKALGFPLVKVTLPYGDTIEGLQLSLRFLQRQRDALPPGFPLACDCWGGLNPELAATFAEMIKPLDLAWLEEPFSVDAARHSRVLKAAAPWLRLASGEHEQSLEGFTRLIDSGIDMIQPDLRWCGGLTAALRVAALADQRGVPVMPHAGGAYSYHFAAGVPQCGILEFSSRSPDGTTVVPCMGDRFDGEPLPVTGYVTLSDRPGFGLSYAIDQDPFKT
jgi:L-rhamnonate dehydratase